MTLLNTISNMGGKWSQTFFLWLVDIISWKECIHDEFSNTTLILSTNKCVNKEEKEICVKNGGKCYTDIDGYYIEAIICLIYGLIFYKFNKKTVEYLGRLPTDDWHILSKDYENVKIKKDENPLSS